MFICLIVLNEHVCVYSLISAPFCPISIIFVILLSPSVQLSKSKEAAILFLCLQEAALIGVEHSSISCTTTSKVKCCYAENELMPNNGGDHRTWARLSPPNFQSLPKHQTNLFSRKDCVVPRLSSNESFLGWSYGSNIMGAQFVSKVRTIIQNEHSIK